MSGGAPPACPPGRSQPRRKRFGFLNIFGFSADSAEAASRASDSASDGDGSRDEASGRTATASFHGSGTAATVAAAALADAQTKPAGAFHQVSGVLTGSRRSRSTSKLAAVAEGNGSSACVADGELAGAVPAPVDILPGDADRTHFHSRGAPAEHMPQRSGSHQSAGGSSMASIGGEPGSSPYFSTSASPLPAARDKGHLHSTSQIRTCPIPEKLRLQMMDSTQDSAGSSSPTVISHAQAYADSPHNLPDIRARRRGTVGSASSASSVRRPSRRSLQGSEKPAARKSSGCDYPLFDRVIVAAPVARRTSSNNSTWSTATPTPTLGAGDTTPSGFAAPQNEPALLPDWDAAAQLPSRSRNRSRRYSVFDMSFASQRPPSTLNSQNELEPNSGGSTRRKLSLKSTTGSIPPIDEKGALDSVRGSDSSGVGLSALESTPPWHNAGSPAVGSSTESGSQISSQPSYLRTSSLAANPAQGDSASPQRIRRHHHHRHRSSTSQQRQQSYATISTISRQGSMDEGLRRTPGQNTPSDHGSESASSRQRQRRPFSTDYHESSSGQSTPSHLLFARLHRRTSNSAKPIGIASTARDHSPAGRQGKSLDRKTGSAGRAVDAHTGSLRCNRSASTMNAQRANTSKLPASSGRCGDSDDDDEAVYQADSEYEGDLELPYLRFSTSTPDVVIMPIISQSSGQMHTIKKPDFFYERLLSLSRSIKAHRWKHRSLAMCRTLSVQSGDTCRDAEANSRPPGSVAPNRLFQFPRGNTASMIDSQPGISRSNSVLKNDAGSPSRMTPRSRRDSHRHAMHDPANLVLWHDWTDDIASHPHTILHQRVVDMWRKITRNWRRSHGSGGSWPPEHRRGSSASYFGAAIPIKPGATFSAASAQSGNSAAPIGPPSDVESMSPSSANATALLKSYLMEPMYLQRGVSESGRQASPNDAIAAMCQVSNYGQIDTPQNLPAASSRESLEFALGTPTQAPGAGGGAATGKSQGPQLSVARPWRSMQPTEPGTREFSDIDVPLTTAPHQRLSIVRGQSLESTQEGSRGSGSGSGSSSQGNSLHSPGMPERNPWLFARLDNPDEAVVSLLTFQSRLQARLAKAKAESEEELVNIIQDLSEFVEEGLSYVNEDSIISDEMYDDRVSVASAAYSTSDESYASDEEGAHIPADTAPYRRRIASPQPKPTQRGHDSHGSRHANAPARGLPPKPGDADSTTWELKSLNKRLHDVLNLHTTSSNESDAERGGYLSAQLSASPKAVPARMGAASAQDSGYTGASPEVRMSRVAQHVSSTARLNRSPSIRRLAFLKALSSDRSGGVASSSSESDASYHNPDGSNDSGHRHPLAAATLFEDLSATSLEHAAHQEYGSDSTLQHTGSMTPGIVVDSADGSEISSISACSQPQVPEFLRLDGPGIRRNETLPATLPSWKLAQSNTAETGSSNANGDRHKNPHHNQQARRSSLAIFDKAAAEDSVAKSTTGGGTCLGSPGSAGACNGASPAHVELSRPAVKDIPFPDLPTRNTLHESHRDDRWPMSPRNTVRSTSSVATSDMLPSAQSSDTESSYSHSHSPSPMDRSVSRASVYSTGSGASLLTSPLIAEDEFKPTPFLRAIMELVNIIGYVIGMAAEDMMRPLSGSLLEEALEIASSEAADSAEDERQRVAAVMPTEYLVQRLTELGRQWEQSQPCGSLDEGIADQPWPCRGLFFRSLLAISSLNRIVMWYVAVRSMYSEDIIEELDRRSGLHLVPGAAGIASAVSGQPAQDPTLNTAGASPVLDGYGEPGQGAQSHSAELSARGSMASLKGGANASRLNSTPSLARSGTSSQLVVGQSPLCEEPSEVLDSPSIVQPGIGASEAASNQPPANSSSLQSATAADKGLNMLMEVSLDGRIRYISPAWQRLLGSDPEALVDQPVSAIFDPEDIQICRSAVEQLLADSTRTVETSIKVHSPDRSAAASVEAKGMLIYSRSRNEPSHVLWVLRFVSPGTPAVPSPPSNSLAHSADSSYRQPPSLSAPHTFVKLEEAAALGQRLPPETDAGVGIDFDARYGQTLDGEPSAAARAQSEDTTPPPSPLESITCRICDRAIPAAYFEEHTWLCAQSHRFAMDVEQQNDSLSDIKAQLHSWYPGCSMAELEDMVHGETDTSAIQQHAQRQAAEIGNPAWQHLVDEADPVVKSMIKACTRAMALDGSDAIPKCNFPRATEPPAVSARDRKTGSGDVDFVRSENWIEVATYILPDLGFSDSSLEALGNSLMETIEGKLSAIDDLQYAIVDSSIACSKWLVPIEDMVADFTPQPQPARHGSVPQEQTAFDLQHTPKNGSASELDSLAPSASGSAGSSQQLQRVASNALVVASTRTIVSTSVPPASAAARACGLETPHADPASAPQDVPGAVTPSAFNAVSPALRKLPASAAAASPLRIATSDLEAMSSGRSLARSGIGSSAFLATPTVPSIHDFVLLKPISKGAYGSVFLAKKRTTGEYYAIKILKKADMIAKNQISNVKAERAIMMAQTGSPFVVRLLFTFQSRTNLYLVMEYLNGGDCASLLKAIGALPEDWARQYLAEVVLGIEDLHGRNVVHRDLKPDNLLIDSEGHLKLTDFGLSKLGFLGRRVDQQSMGQQMSASDAAPRAGAVPATPISSGRVWQPYVANPVSTPQPLLSAPAASQPHGGLSDTSSFTPRETMVQTAMALPSISTPPPIKRDGYYESGLVSGSNLGGSAAGNDVGGESSHSGAADPATSKRVAMLKESPAIGSSASASSAHSHGSTGTDASCSSSASNASAGGGAGTASVPSDHHKRALGTPDYIAPESILGLESGESVDWWALGVICYEFLFGIPPFHGETPEKVFSNILSADIDFHDELRKQVEQEHELKRKQEEERKLQSASAGSGQDSASMDIGANENGGDDEDEDDDEDPGVPDISPEARDFITRLLCRDPKRRLGYNGSAEVKSHPFFKDVNWNTLLDTQPAFVPQVEDIEDTDYFDLRGATMDSDHPALGLNDSHLSASRSSATGKLGSQSHQASAPKDSLSLTSQDSHPVPEIGSGVAMHRPKTTPPRLIESPRCEDCTAPQGALPIPPTGVAMQTAPRHDYESDLPSLDEDPEFGGFTFKNLHALEQANFNEIVKLRRRSTLIDIPSHAITRSDMQSSTYAHSSMLETPPALPPARRHRSHLGSSISSVHSAQSEVSSGYGDSYSSRDTHSLLSPPATGDSPLKFGIDYHSWDHQNARSSISAGVPITRATTIASYHTAPFFGEDDGSSGSGSGSGSRAGRGRSVSASRETASALPSPYAWPTHARTSSANSHRGSLLNPNTELALSARGSQRLAAIPTSSMPMAMSSPPNSKLGVVANCNIMQVSPPPLRLSRTSNDLPRFDMGQQQQPQQQQQQQAAPPPQPALVYLQSKICLVADDNPVCCKIMEIVLKRMHLECAIVRNGAEAIRCAMGRTVFRAIFMDTGMPIVDGDEATRMIKSTYNANRDTPVIAMTAYEGEATDALYDGAIAKPVTFQHVKRSLSEHPPSAQS